MKKSIVFIFLCGLVFGLHAQNVANFKITTNLAMVGCRSTKATFKNQSICPVGRTCGYVWHWGDGSKDEKTLNLLDVTHTFNKDGAFRVSMTVIDTTTKEVLGLKSMTDSIKVYFPQASGFTALEDTVSYQIKFDASASFKPFHKEAWLYNWNWGDGEPDSTFSDPKTRHLYHAENFSKGYNVTLTLTINEAAFQDDNQAYNTLKNCTDTFSMPVEVTDAFFDDATKKKAVGDRIPKLPNIITPDNKYGTFSLDSTDANPDLKSNDVFYFKSNGEDIFTIKIYNRWGGLVFEKTSKVIYWDAVDMNESPVDSGVYFYVIESEQADKRHNKAGFVHVFREN